MPNRPRKMTPITIQNAGVKPLWRIGGAGESTWAVVWGAGARNGTATRATRAAALKATRMPREDLPVERLVNWSTTETAMNAKLPATRSRPYCRVGSGSVLPTRESRSGVVER